MLDVSGSSISDNSAVASELITVRVSQSAFRNIVNSMPFFPDLSIRLWLSPGSQCCLELSIRGYELGSLRKVNSVY